MFNTIFQNANCKNEKNNGLLLYHHPYSYYSQKVLMALHEKQVPFKEYLINLVKNEQYESWFLDLNPRGEFPVLYDEHSSKIVLSSNKIIDYLEDIAHNDNSQGHLNSMELDLKIRQKITYFRCELEQIQSGIITLGSFFHEDYVFSPKIPFIRPVRSALKVAENNRIHFLMEQMKSNPKHKEVFLQKIRNSIKRHEIITSREEFLHQLDLVTSVLNKIEEELASHHQTNFWLCCETFTIADINLTVLLERLWVLGLDNHFWGNGKRPHVEQYFKRVKLRDSYRKSMPNMRTHLKLLSQGEKTFKIASGALVTTILFFGGWLFVRKLGHY